jgi:hypothetical protein
LGSKSRTHVVQMRSDGVDAPPEVQVVGKIEGVGEKFLRRPELVARAALEREGVLYQERTKERDVVLTGQEKERKTIIYYVPVKKKKEIYTGSKERKKEIYIYR